jgi:purine-binding chemotaxis protein CheW
MHIGANNPSGRTPAAADAARFAAEDRGKGEHVPSTVALSEERSMAVKTDERAGKYLVFHLGNEEFGIRVLKVREIMGVLDITAVPQTPAYVKGVINLRGKVIPVVDLRLKFGLPETEYTQRTCIIVVQVQGEGGVVLMGIVVDGVAEVLNLAPGDIEDTPDFGQGVATPYLLGMAKIKGKVKILLEINQVLTSQELHGIEAVLS